MVFEANLVDVGVALLVVVALAEYAKFRAKASKGFSWIVLAGVWLVFAGTFAAAPTFGGWIGGSIWQYGKALFEVAGWVFALLGTLFVAYEIIVER